jgi:hypothetical protein
LDDVPVLPVEADDRRGSDETPATPDPYLHVVPTDDPQDGSSGAADLVRESQAANVDQEAHLAKIAAATRYLYRCRRAGDTRTTSELLRDIVSSGDADALEAAVAGFFAEDRLT